MRTTISNNFQSLCYIMRSSHIYLAMYRCCQVVNVNVRIIDHVATISGFLKQGECSVIAQQIFCAQIFGQISHSFWIISADNKSPPSHERLKSSHSFVVHLRTHTFVPFFYNYRYIWYYIFLYKFGNILAEHCAIFDRLVLEPPMYPRIKSVTAYICMLVSNRVAFGWLTASHRLPTRTTTNCPSVRPSVCPNAMLVVGLVDAVSDVICC